MKPRILPLALLGGFALTLGSAPAEITLLNTGGRSILIDFTESVTLSFNAGVGATKLVVSLTDEHAVIGAAAYSFSYNGAPLTYVTGSSGNRFRGFWYLDNPYTGGAAPLTLFVAANNGLRFGVASIVGAAPGAPAVVGARSTTDTATITPAEAGSFVMVGGGAGGATGFINDPDLTLITYGDARSCLGYVGYQNNVPAEATSYTFGFTTVDQWEARAIAFSPAPPSSAIPLTITPNGANFDFTWDSQPGKVYDLLTSTDLATPIAEWPIYNDGVTLHENIPSAGTTTTLTNVPSSDPRRFFAIREEVAP